VGGRSGDLDCAPCEAGSLFILGGCVCVCVVNVGLVGVGPGRWAKIRWILHEGFAPEVPSGIVEQKQTVRRVAERQRQQSPDQI
jgi:hypothetical protein